MGLMGYFPSYALGNLISVQLWDQMEKEMPDRDEKMEKVNSCQFSTGFAAGCMRMRASLNPALVQKVTGSRSIRSRYLRYLTQKYSELYHL